MKKMRRFVLLFLCCLLFCGLWNGTAHAEDYSDGGCVRWAKDRAKEKLGIELPATGNWPSGVDGASNWWYVLPQHGYGTGSEPAANSLAIWKKDSSSSAYGHVAYVESVDGDMVTVTEGGYSWFNPQTQQWDYGYFNNNKGVKCRTQSKSAMATLGGCSEFLGYIYLGKSVPTTSWSNKTQTVSETNAQLGITYNAGRSVYFGYVGLCINGNYACGWDPGYTGSSYSFSFDLNKDAGITLTPGQTYKYKFYVNTMTGSDIFSSEYSFTVPKRDTTKPVITDAKVIDLDSSGYTVQCKVTDNIAVDRVQCPTWTKEGDQDDIAKDWSTNSSVKATNKGNGIYEFRVKISDHNNEYGLYHTHIYAYDTSGNYSCAVLNNINVLMGDIFDIGNDVYTWVKTYNGRYCWNKYSNNYQRDSLDDAYLDVTTELNNVLEYSYYVYHFIKTDNVYEMFLGTSSLGKCLILDDGTEKGYLITQYGTNKVWTYDEEHREVRLKKYSKSNENQYFEFEDIIKKSRPYYNPCYETDFYYEYDGKEHTIDHNFEIYATVFYKTSEQGEWSDTKPTRKDVGNTKVYYKIVSPCYYDTYGMDNLTVSNKENCTINIDRITTLKFQCKHARGMVICPQVLTTTTFTSFKIVTSVIKNGLLITDEKEYGPITIESDFTGGFPVLVDPINFENADGEYTTTISLTSVTGEKYQRTVQYDFKYYHDDIVKRIKVGESFTISTDRTNDHDAFQEVDAYPAEYTSGTVDIQKNEDTGSYSITGTETGRVYLWCWGSRYFNICKMMIVDIIDNNPSDNPSEITDETTTTEQPKPEEPATEQPKSEETTTEQPKLDEPVAEQEKSEEAATTEQQPAVKQPTTTEQQPTTEQQVTTAPAKSVSKPAKVTGLQVKNKKGRKLSVSWQWQTGVSGFQIQYAQNKKFTKKLKTKTAGKWSDSKTISGLKKGKTYYVRVRGYKNSSSGKVYGKWSKVKKIKIK